MASITFLAPRQPDGTLERIQVDLLPGGREDTLLDLIERQGLRHPCECRDGTCGQCAVKVAVVNPDTGEPGVFLGRVERETLYACGRLTRHQYASPVLASHRPLWRLACQYAIGEEDIVVAL
jgi:hypothetical protein